MKFSIICLQETWIDESEDISVFHLQGYDCISQGKTCTSKGGLMIYVDDQYKSKVTFNLKGQTKLTFTWHTPNRVNIN